MPKKPATTSTNLVHATPSETLNADNLLAALSGEPNQLPCIDTEEQWIRQGQNLGTAATSMLWIVGAWWNAGTRFSRRVQIVKDPAWTGPSYGTCRNAGRIAKRYGMSWRHDSLTYAHHEAVASLPQDEAEQLLSDAAARQAATGKAPSANQLRQQIKQQARAEREQRLAARTAEVNRQRHEERYGVVLADPPWQFDTYSVDGMDRAPDNHYGTLTTDEIKDIPVPAARDCVLFLWATVPRLVDALAVMEAWGFTYKSHCVWFKDKIGLGYWFRNQHELLLVGTRGDAVAPAMGTQFTSIQAGKRQRHSEKPELFHEIIETYFPAASKIEMFARRFRQGWVAFGNELPPALHAAE